jgi:hypothetical protein
VLGTILQDFISWLSCLDWNKVSFLDVEIFKLSLSSDAEKHFFKFSESVLLLLHGDEALIELLPLQAHGIVLFLVLAGARVHPRSVASTLDSRIRLNITLARV